MLLLTLLVKTEPELEPIPEDEDIEDVLKHGIIVLEFMVDVVDNKLLVVDN